MSTIAQNLAALQQAKSDIADAITAKGGTVNAGDGFADFAADIGTIPSGGAQTGGDDVIFIDYDGTVLYSYSKAAFLALTEFPEKPSHPNLTSPQWNQYLNTAQSYVQTYNKLVIGAVYSGTTSGKSEFDIELTKVTGLSVTLNIDGEKDWGDGTIDSTTAHTYSSYGTYTIYVTKSNSVLYVDIMGQSSSNPNYSLKAVRLVSGYSQPNSSSDAGVFEYCYSLESISLTAQYGNKIVRNMFRFCKSLKALVLIQVTSVVREGVYACDALKYVSFGFSLSTPLDLDPYAFRSCRTLRTITLPTHLRSLGDTAFYQCYGSGITEIVIPSSTTSVYASCFRYCYNIKSIIVYGTIDSNSSYAFEYIYSLTNIEFLGSTTAMPQNILNGCSNLKYVKIPNTVTSIGSQAFGNMVNCTYDFTEFTSIPTCASDSFVGITGLSKIVIPDSLYSSWIAETNWVNYANNIYRASEVTI